MMHQWLGFAAMGWRRSLRVLVLGPGFNAPDTVPSPEAGSSKTNSAGVPRTRREAQRSTSTPSQVTRARQANHQQIAFRVRQHEYASLENHLASERITAPS